MNSTFQLPEAFSGMIGLGSPKAWHPAKKWNRIGSLVFSLVLLGAGLLVFLYGLYDTYIAYQKHGSAMIDDKLLVPTLIAFVMFALGLLAAWSAYANWHKGVAVFDRGFAHRDRKGIRTWTWEDVTSFRAAVTRHYTNGIYTGTTHVYTLLNRQSEKLVLSDSLTTVEELAGTIEQVIFPRLYAQAAAQYNSGQALVFGPVTVKKSGIEIGKKVYPWPEVGQVSIQKGFLRVSKKGGGWFSGASAAASAIPNLRVLLSIIDQISGVKAG
jgi:hypothetical protein